MTSFLKFKLFVILFLYVFAFFFKGISVSIILGIILWEYATINPLFWKFCMNVLHLRFIRNVFFVWFIVSLVAILYPIICFSFDFSFAKLILTQSIHLLSAIPVFAWLLHKKISFISVEQVFIWIFVLQTVIQIVVYLTPSLGTAILEYNHFEPDSVVGLGSAVRGKALSAATTYHLTMAYGIAFILYLKYYFISKISLPTVFIGLLLFIGIFFAGRTGFVGCLIGAIGSVFDKETTIKIKWNNLFRILIYVTLVLLCMWGVMFSFFPDVLDKINMQVLPYAFEFLYSLDKSGQMETASTNRLMEMWNADFSFFDLIVGTGKYTNSDGSFYMHVDPGILRHTLFMGLIGYILLVYYQFVVFPINKFKEKRNKYYSFLIMLFLIVMEFKCINLGVNKFAFSITLLLSFSYLYLPDYKITHLYAKENNACLRHTSRSDKNGSAGQGVPETSPGV